MPNDLEGLQVQLLKDSREDQQIGDLMKCVLLNFQRCCKFLEAHTAQAAAELSRALLQQVGNRSCEAADASCKN
eukprot:2085397-Karenia_brevis.AAC.1